MAAIRVQTSDSVSIWRISRARPAPIASRTAISRPRPAPRASSRFAALAQATTSNSPTSPNRNHNGCAKRLRTREKPVRADSSEVVLPRYCARRPASRFGGAVASSAAGQTRPSPAFASASVIPPRSRPIR